MVQSAGSRARLECRTYDVHVLRSNFCISSAGRPTLYRVDSCTSSLLVYMDRLSPGTWSHLLLCIREAYLDVHSLQHSKTMMWPPVHESTLCNAVHFRVAIPSFLLCKHTRADLLFCRQGNELANETLVCSMLV
jgi:hypothetical protein